MVENCVEGNLINTLTLLYNSCNCKINRNCFRINREERIDQGKLEEASGTKFLIIYIRLTGRFAGYEYLFFVALVINNLYYSNALI
jgi:hypothetical protein